MSKNTWRASVLGLGAALALALGTSTAAVLDEDDTSSRQTVVKTQATASTPVSQSHMPLCAWRHCSITP